MAIAIKVRRGGAVGALETDFTPQVQLYRGSGEPLLSTAMMFGSGSAAQSTFLVDDDVGEIHRADFLKNLHAHTVVTTSEDAPGFAAWLGRGRIASKSVGRGQVAHGAARQWDVTVEDANTDLKGLTLLAAWDRPQEFDYARIVAMLSAFCNGSPRPSTVISNHLVSTASPATMPAKVYPIGTELTEILADCATTASKRYGVVIHHLASVSHLCLLYITEGDITTFVSDLGVTDDAPDLVNWFPPEWDQGAATIEESQELVTGIVSRYTVTDKADVTTEASVFVQDAADVAAYDYWVLPFSDVESETAAQAAVRAEAVRESRSSERMTHSLSIMIPATQVHRLCAGMAIQIRADAAIAGQYLNTVQTRRIAQLKWEQVAPAVGAVPAYYKAHMQLDRPMQLAPMSAGVGSVAYRALSVGTRATQQVQDLSMGGANLVKNSSFESTGGWYVGAHWDIEHNPSDPEAAYHGQHVARLSLSGSVPESGELMNV